ncbi:MAG: hypothetical protein ABIQ95_13220 [Bdellovibrionia bacterium]
MEQWLIRTAKNWIAGPYSKEQVCKMILDGSLGLQDEVCPANGYWILLHERKEIFTQLGVQVPRISGAEDEITENEIPVDNLTGQEESSDKKSFTSSTPAPQRATSGSTTFLVREPSSTSSNLAIEDEVEKVESRKGLTFIIIGIGLLLLIALRAFKH